MDLPVDILEGWLPPSRENWELTCRVFQFFPIVFTTFHFLTDWYPQGKTSVASRFNLPGKWAWFLMEIPGFITVNYIVLTLPQKLGIEALPIGNWTMAAMFTVHYIYRAILSPLFLNPSMSPIHLLFFVCGAAFQVINGICIGGWLAGYGPRTLADWGGRAYYAEIGMMIWAAGFMGNMFHDDELREIRRQAARKQMEQGESSKGVDKVYVVPQNGLFRAVLYPHFFCEWVEWAGFWMMGGLGCIPARTFLINEISTMLPRALSGRRWYIKRFGKEKIGNKKAVIPGIL